MSKLKQYNIRLDEEIVKNIDRIVKEDPFYENRSAYIRSMLRLNAKRDKMRLELDRTAVKMAKLSKDRGAKLGLLTREEKIKIANEFLKEKGFK